MNIQETGGIPWGDYIGKLFDTIASERQADRAHEMKMEEINAMKTTANSNETYTAGQAVGTISMPQNMALYLGIAAIAVGIFVALKQ